MRKVQVVERPQSSHFRIITTNINVYVFLFSWWAGGIQQILQSDWFLEWAEFSNTNRFSRRNPSSWSVFFWMKERLSSIFCPFHTSIDDQWSINDQWIDQRSMMARKVTVSKFNFIFWSCESLYAMFGCLLLGAVMARNPVCLCTILSKNWVNFSRVSLCNRSCIWESSCGVHLTNFLAIYYSIYGRKVQFSRVIRNDRQKLFCSTTSNFARNFTPRKQFWRP